MNDNKKEELVKYVKKHLTYQPVKDAKVSKLDKELVITYKIELDNGYTIIFNLMPEAEIADICYYHYVNGVAIEISLNEFGDTFYVRKVEGDTITGYEVKEVKK